MTQSEKTSALNAWYRADLMFKHFGEVPFNPSLPFKTVLAQPFIVYAYLFHALVFTVLEFLKEKDSIPSSIKSDVMVHWDNLRLFRNAVFHIQDEVVSPKTMALVESDLHIKVVYRIHSEIGKYLEHLSPTD
jgi:hypothetical protein